MQQPDSFRLVVRRGPQPNQTYAISKDLTTLGRDITNDIVINDRETSRHHLRLQRAADTVTVEDLGSTNGTFINGKRVSGAATLQNGDMVGLGETVTLAFEIQRAQQMPAAAPAAGGGLSTPAPLTQTLPWKRHRRKPRMVPRPLHLPGSSRWPIPIRRPLVNPRRRRRLPIPSSHRRCNSRPITASPLPATRFLPHRNRSRVMTTIPIRRGKKRAGPRNGWF